MARTLATYTLLQGLWYGQRMLVYPAGYFDLEGYPPGPYMYALQWTDVTLTTKDNIKLHCYFVRRNEEEEVKRSRGTIILFHGNAMTKSSLLPYAANAYHARFNALTLEYRGYDGNKGHPSEKGLRLDAQAALDHVLAHPILSTKPVILFGQSMGGAVAIDLASRNASKISALIIENTFTSIPDVLSDRMPLLLKPIRYLCTQHWNSRRKIKKLPPSLPILMFSGLLDTVVPPEHMQNLWHAAQTRHLKKGRLESIRRVFEKIWKAKNKSSPKTDIQDEVSNLANKDEFFTFEEGDHIYTREEPGYEVALRSFLNKIFPSDQPEISSSHSSED